MRFLIYHFRLIEIDHDGEAADPPIYTQGDGCIRRGKKNVEKASLFQPGLCGVWLVRLFVQNRS